MSCIIWIGQVKFIRIKKQYGFIEYCIKKQYGFIEYCIKKQYGFIEKQEIYFTLHELHSSPKHLKIHDEVFFKINKRRKGKKKRRAIKRKWKAMNVTKINSHQLTLILSMNYRFANYYHHKTLPIEIDSSALICCISKNTFLYFNNDNNCINYLMGNAGNITLKTDLLHNNNRFYDAGIIPYKNNCNEQMYLLYGGTMPSVVEYNHTLNTFNCIIDETKAHKLLGWSSGNVHQLLGDRFIIILGYNLHIYDIFDHKIIHTIVIDDCEDGMYYSYAMINLNSKQNNRYLMLAPKCIFDITVCTENNFKLYINAEIPNEIKMNGKVLRGYHILQIKEFVLCYWGYIEDSKCDKATYNDKRIGIYNVFKNKFYWSNVELPQKYVKMIYNEYTNKICMFDSYNYYSVYAKLIISDLIDYNDIDMLVCCMYRNNTYKEWNQQLTAVINMFVDY
eukprot:84124_1